ncbi:hypothetical protein, conserved [Leishmania shawi]|uniref:Uncharacterized protein n=1 Tax=Leishmania shawi TaxID=5680 RepID=A0ABR3E9H5_9TRYP
MSSSSSAPQREQLQQQVPWTFSAYHTVVLTEFVSALQAEVRRQQDAYDHAVEMLNASVDTGPTSDMLELGIPLHATHEEQVQVLQDMYALATLDTRALVALGPYRLLYTLKANMTRIEDERRAGAVAAGNGTGGRKMRLDRPPFVLKSETSIGTTALECNEDSPTPKHHVVPPLSVRIKAERIDNDMYEGVAQQQQFLSEHSPLASLSLSLTTATPALMPAKEERHSTKGATVSSVGGAGAGGLGGGCPPSWVTLKKEAAQPPPSNDTYNGAYFVPCPTPTGAPLARYVSLSARSLSTNNSTQSPSAPLPTLVAPVSSWSKVMSSTNGKKRPAALSSQVPKRCRSVTTSQANAVAADKELFLSQAQRPKVACMQNRVRLLHRPHSPSSPSKETREGDRALQLWWRVWPNFAPMWLPDVRKSEQQQRTTTAPPSIPHECVRPTPAMVAALIRVAEQNYERDCERCAAKQAYLTTMLDTPESLRVSGVALGTADAKNAGQATLETSLVLPDPQALRQLQDELASAQAKLNSAYAERLALLRELKAALQDESVVCVDGATVSEAGETKHAAPSPVSRAQHRAASPSGGLKRSQRSSSTHYATRASTAIDVEARNADRRGEGEAVSDISTKSAAAGVAALELLHSALADPTSLLQKAYKARDSLAFCSSEVASSARTRGPRSQAASEETWDLPNGIIGINLPSLEHDRNAPDLMEYLWPEDLDALIRHELRGVVSAKSHNPEARSVHVVLSAVQVRQLEEAACAVSTGDSASQLQVVVLPMVAGSLMAHPKFVESGWLYVHGRGETIGAEVELN